MRPVLSLMEIPEEEIKEDGCSPSTGELELDKMLEDGDNRTICHICGEKPCDWICYGEDLIQRGETTFVSEIMTNNIIQKSIYSMYIYGKYGHLGKGRRICIPICVRDGIRKRWPESNPEDYMGYGT